MDDDLHATLKALARRFQDRCERERLELLARSETQAGGPRMREIAHGLAGAGGTFGFPQISVLARELEQAIDAGAPTSAKLSRLLEEMARRSDADLAAAI